MYQVVGYDEGGEPIYQAVHGSVMGGAVMGAGPMAVIGAHGHHHPARRQIHIPPRPQWRDHELATGVVQPDEGMLPMPLTGSSGTNVFSVAQGNAPITFQGQMQKPYRAERLMFIVTRVGASGANIRVQGQIFVGTDLQQGELGLIDFESLGAPTAFGTRLTCTPANPGVFLRLQTQLVGGVLTGTDTILVTTYFLGRVIH
jgi:hypothetical protein